MEILLFSREAGMKCGDEVSGLRLKSCFWMIERFKIFFLTVSHQPQSESQILLWALNNDSAMQLQKERPTGLFCAVYSTFQLCFVFIDSLPHTPCVFVFLCVCTCPLYADCRVCCLSPGALQAVLSLNIYWCLLEKKKKKNQTLSVSFSFSGILYSSP